MGQGRLAYIACFAVALHLSGCDAEDPAPPSSSPSPAHATPTSPELLSALPRGFHLASLEVGEKSVYLAGDGVIFAMAKSGGTPEPMARGVEQWVHGIAVDGPRTYWFTGSAIASHDAETGRIATVYTPRTVARVMSLSSDAARLYLVAPGCGSIESVAKDGTAPKSVSQEVDVSVGGQVPAAIGSHYVYCGGGLGGPTSSKLFRWRKGGGPLEVMHDLGPADAYGFRPQVAAIVEVDGAVYYLRGYAPSRLAHALEVLRPGASRPEVLAEIRSAVPSRLHFDPKRRAFYWLASSTSQVAKYSLKTKALTFFSAQGAVRGPLAADRSYLYWSTTDGVFRAPKF